ncbi:MAG: phospholipid carrier-dependent glycosyltransferase [Desulfobacterales bacterium]|nr:phospholipid carrier-dependent glycosyltransferase [Desulfobacterales bacterium]
MKILISIIPILLLIIITIPLCLVPPISTDALVQHLAIPKLYLEHGGIYEMPSMVYSYYPMNLDLLYIIPLYFRNDIAPKFIHYSFALMTAMLIFFYLRNRLNYIWGIVGGSFFLSIPIIIKLSITVYVDLGLIFFSTSSLLLLLKWRDCGFKPKFLILSAIFCGLAIGTKYNGLITFVVILLFVPLIYSQTIKDSKDKIYKSLIFASLFFIVTLFLASPWLLRNYYWTKNPVYPLYNNIFNSQQSIQDESLDEDNITMDVFSYRRLIYNESWGQIISLPIRIFFQGKDRSGQYFDGKLNPFLLFLPFFAFFKIKNESVDITFEKKIFLAFIILVFIYSFFSSLLLIRYISQIIPPLVILSIFGLKNITIILNRYCIKYADQLGWITIILIITAAYSINIDYIIKQYNYIKPFSYINGKVNRDEYISNYRFEHPVMMYINKKLPNDALVLLIYLGGRGYYCDRNYIPDIKDHATLLHNIIKATGDAQGILNYYKIKNITHIVIQTYFFNRRVNELFSNEDKLKIEDFFRNYTTLLYSKNHVAIFKLNF